MPSPGTYVQTCHINRVAADAVLTGGWVNVKANEPAERGRAGLPKLVEQFKNVQGWIHENACGGVRQVADAAGLQARAAPKPGMF